MRTIDLRFVTEPGLSSWLIRKFGGDLGFSHVGAMVSGYAKPEWWPSTPPYGRARSYEFGARSDVMGSLTGAAGVQLRPADYARFSRVAIVRIPVTAEEHRAFWASAVSRLGDPYGTRTIVGLILGRELRDKGHWICSTGEAWDLVNAGIAPEEWRPHLQQITPDSLWLAATALAAARY